MKVPTISSCYVDKIVKSITNVLDNVVVSNFETIKLQFGARVSPNYEKRTLKRITIPHATDCADREQTLKQYLADVYRCTDKLGKVVIIVQPKTSEIVHCEYYVKQDWSRVKEINDLCETIIRHELERVIIPRHGWIICTTVSEFNTRYYQPNAVMLDIPHPTDKESCDNIHAFFTQDILKLIEGKVLVRLNSRCKVGPDGKVVWEHLAEYGRPL